MTTKEVFLERSREDWKYWTTPDAGHPWFDFKEIKKAAREVSGELDHRYLNDLAAFSEINPTAENIASYLFRGLSERLNNERVRISAVTLWETDRACVRYTED